LTKHGAAWGRTHTGKKPGRPRKDKAAASEESLHLDRMSSELAKAEETMKNNHDALLVQNLIKLRERHYFATDEVAMAEGE
jgi:hypothetical protein